jgi:peptidyl-prolyl cis-trans isomerase B (cyclophilin B)
LEADLGEIFGYRPFFILSLGITLGGLLIHSLKSFLNMILNRSNFSSFLLVIAAPLLIWACSSAEPLAEQGPKRVLIETSFGEMILELSDSTPGHRDNFVKLVDEGFYDGLLFHRVIQDFMVQGGDPGSRGAKPGKRLGSGGPGYTLDAEIRADHLHTKGALSAARQGDNVNPAKKSSGSQFYLVQGKPQSQAQMRKTQRRVQSKAPEFEYTEDQLAQYATAGGTPFLDMDYTVFGYVVAGIDIIDSIAAVETARGDRPVEDVIMNMRVIR